MLTLLCPGQDLEVLDVGGHFSSWKLLRPGDVLTAADPKPRPTFAYRPSVPFRCDRYVRAAGGRLPFRDNSFAVVTAHDTLEHVPADARIAFLDDLARVSRRFVVLNGPIWSPEAEEAEHRIARMWRDALEAPDHALAEHLRHGLPRAEVVEDWLARRGMPFTSVPNGSLAVWTVTMALKTYLQGLPDADPVHESLDRLFNSSVAPGDRFPPCYRLAYVAARDRGEAAALARVEEAFAGPPGGDATVDPAAVTMFVDDLEAHLVRMRRLVAELRSSLDSVNADAAWRQDRIDELEGAVADLRTAAAEREARIGERQRQIDQEARIEKERSRLARELEEIRASTAYRMAERGRRTLRWSFPPGTTLGRILDAVRRGLGQGRR